MGSIHSNKLMYFNTFEALLFNLVVNINENEGPKGCLKCSEKQTNIIQKHCIQTVSGKLLRMVLSADGCPRQRGLAGWAGLESYKYSHI